MFQQEQHLPKHCISYKLPNIQRPKSEKRRWHWGARYPIRTVPRLFVTSFPFTLPSIWEGDGVTLLHTASIAGQVQSSNSGSCQPLLFCGLSHPPRFAIPFTNHAPWCNIQPSFTPPHWVLEKKYIEGGNDIWREKEGDYIDWGKDVCVIIIG